MRGQIFNNEDRSNFTFGGGLRIDKVYRIIVDRWQPEEEPSEEECSEAMEHLEEAGFLIE